MSVDIDGRPGARGRAVGGLRVKVVPGGFPLGAFLGGTAVLMAVAIHLLHLDRLGITVCVFKAVTGLPCFTCGGTRAFGRLASGDVAGALRMNPLVTLAALALPPWTLADLALLPRRSALGLEVSQRATRVLVIVGVGAVLLNWAYLVGAGR